jgi:hypothetical protein
MNNGRFKKTHEYISDIHPISRNLSQSIMLNYHTEWAAKTFPTGRKGKDEWMILNQARKEITKFLNNSKFEKCMQG